MAPFPAKKKIYSFLLLVRLYCYYTCREIIIQIFSHSELNFNYYYYSLGCLKMSVWWWLKSDDWNAHSHTMQARIDVWSSYITFALFASTHKTISWFHHLRAHVTYTLLVLFFNFKPNYHFSLDSKQVNMCELKPTSSRIILIVHKFSRLFRRLSSSQHTYAAATMAAALKKCPSCFLQSGHTVFTIPELTALHLPQHQSKDTFLRWSHLPEPTGILMFTTEKREMVRDNILRKWSIRRLHTFLLRFIFLDITLCSAWSVSTNCCSAFTVLSSILHKKCYAYIFELQWLTIK